MKSKTVSIIIMIAMAFILSSCSSTSAFVVDNSIPHTKVILQKDPNQQSFYSATYSSISQDIYNNNTTILMLKDGANKYPLDETAKEYAIYFISTKWDDNNKTETWKFLINPNSESTFTISDSGEIVKS
jgi:hypothetical protein